MSWPALETCLNNVPSQRRCRRRRKVDHHPSSSCCIGARRRRDLVTHPVLQRDHVSRSALRQDLGRDHLQVLTSPDLSGRSLRRPQMAPRNPAPRRRPLAVGRASQRFVKMGVAEIHLLVNAVFVLRPVRFTRHVAALSEPCPPHKSHQINTPSRPRLSNGLCVWHYCQTANITLAHSERVFGRRRAPWLVLRDLGGHQTLAQPCQTARHSSD